MHRRSIEREFHANQLTSNTYSHSASFALGRNANNNFVAHSATTAIVANSATNTYFASFGLGRNVKTNFQPSSPIVGLRRDCCIFNTHCCIFNSSINTYSASFGLGSVKSQIQSQNQCQSAHQSSKKLIHNYIVQSNMLSLDLTLLKCHNQLL